MCERVGKRILRVCSSGTVNDPTAQSRLFRDFSMEVGVRKWHFSAILLAHFLMQGCQRCDLTHAILQAVCRRQIEVYAVYRLRLFFLHTKDSITFCHLMQVFSSTTLKRRRIEPKSGTVEYPLWDNCFPPKRPKL
jgi:hypothetical protein